MTEDPKTAGARHTPSPWHMATGPDGLITIFAGDADDPGDDDEFIAGDVDERNACLITAAPELLAAARDMLVVWEGVAHPALAHRDGSPAARLRAAIAKAEEG
jgi:hypothetical protein